MSKMRFIALNELSSRKPIEVCLPSNKLSDYYASRVFDKKTMQEYLPKEAYKAVIDAIEISLGVGGNTHDYYEDALAVICANGKKLPLHIDGSIGSDLRILIESVNNSDVAEFAPEMKITLKGLS